MTQITFLSRHYPPNPNINGESIWDMAKYIEENRGINSNILCIDRSFGGGGQRREPVGNVINLKPIYQGNNPLLRFIGFLYDGFLLTSKAISYKNTLIICTTSPPLLPFWASLLFRRSIKWAVWEFDLFPEGFAVTNFISKNNLFYRWVKKITYSGSPSFLIALGPKQAEHLQKEYNKSFPTVILPCGVLFYQDKSEVTPEWWEPGKIFVGYCGNLNDAHNPDFVKAVIDNIDSSRQRLILALYGNKASEVKEYARNKPGVYVVESVPRNQLHFIDVHLVSLRKEWTHIAIPSKAVSAVCSGSTILFCGDKESDNWHLLQKAGWLINEDSTIQEQVKAFFNAVNPEDLLTRKQVASGLYKELKERVIQSYNQVADFGEKLSE